MSDHLIAEANRHAMTLPTTHPTHADIAWYVREVDQLRDELAAARQRETIAIASWDEERNRALREGERVVEWRDRAERAEAELAAERARLDYIDALSPNDAWVICSTGPFAMAHLRAGDPRTLRILPGIRTAIDAAMKEGA